MDNDNKIFQVQTLKSRTLVKPTVHTWTRHELLRGVFLRLMDSMYTSIISACLFIISPVFMRTSPCCRSRSDSDLSSWSHWSAALEEAGCRSPLLNWMTEGLAALAAAGLGRYSAPGFFSRNGNFPMLVGSFR